LLEKMWWGIGQLSPKFFDHRAGRYRARKGAFLGGNKCGLAGGALQKICRDYLVGSREMRDTAVGAREGNFKVSTNTGENERVGW